jgi:hypothetical protein
MMGRKNLTPMDRWDSLRHRLVLLSVVQRLFFPVNGGIYFIPWPGANRKSSIQFLSFPTAKVCPISGSPRSALSVSPDGPVLLFSQIDEAGSDLILVENFQ